MIDHGDTQIPVNDLSRVVKRLIAPLREDRGLALCQRRERALGGRVWGVRGRVLPATRTMGGGDDPASKIP